MDAGDILPDDYPETNLHPIRVWGAGGGGGEGCGAWGLEIFLVVSIYKTRLTCWCLAERALFGRSRIIFPLFSLVGITPVMWVTLKSALNVLEDVVV